MKASLKGENGILGPRKQDGSGRVADASITRCKVQQMVDTAGTVYYKGEMGHKYGLTTYKVRVSTSGIVEKIKDLKTPPNEVVVDPERVLCFIT